MKTASWVIRNNKTREVLFETFNFKLVKKINKIKYEAIPILDYLVSINGKETK